MDAVLRKSQVEIGADLARCEAESPFILYRSLIAALSAPTFFT
jgi:hypothetical protein